MPAPRCGSGGRPRPLPRAGASPRLLPPSLRVLAAPSARKGSFLRPLAALALRSASRPFAPPLPSLARGSGALWGVLAPLRLGLALASGGVAGAPLPRPLRGFARSRSPGGAPAGAACAAPFGASVAPAGLGLVLPPLRRRRVCVLLFRRVAGLWAGAALLCSCARSMLHQACACCPHSRCLAWALVSPPEKIDNAFKERDSPQKIRRAAAISAYANFPRKLGLPHLQSVVYITIKARLLSTKSLRLGKIIDVYHAAPLFSGALP